MKRRTFAVAFALALMLVGVGLPLHVQGGGKKRLYERLDVVANVLRNEDHARAKEQAAALAKSIDDSTT